MSLTKETKQKHLYIFFFIKEHITESTVCVDNANIPSNNIFRKFPQCEPRCLELAHQCSPREQRSGS